MKQLFAIFTVLLMIACKHDHKPASPELQKAYAIQQEALSMSKSLDGGNLPVTVANQKANWLKNMVEIPGMDHDHANCNHDHSRQTISITDTEMIAVQQAWKDSLVAIINRSNISVNE